MSALRLYAPALVMVAWACVGALSVSGLLLTIAAVASIVAAIYVHVHELYHRKDHRHVLPRSFP